MEAFAIALTLIIGIYGLYLGVHAVALARLTPIPRLVPEALPTISVVIAARNEASNVKSLVESLLAQDYPTDKLTYIIIDDHSTDDTLSLLLTEARNLPNSSVRQLAKGKSGKKEALQQGISQSDSEIILCTDADTSHGPLWAQSMAAAFSDPSTVAVSGPVRLVPNAKHSILCHLQSVESAGLVGLGAAAIALGLPTLANGANLAFRRKSFHEVGGYASRLKVASGDDELLLHKLHRLSGARVRFQIATEAIVLTATEPTIKHLIRQRLRWVSKSRAYANPATTIGQTIAYLAQWAQLGVAAAACTGFVSVALALILISLKWGAEALGFALANARLRTASSFTYILPLLCLYPLYVLAVGTIGPFIQGYIWKGRRTR